MPLFLSHKVSPARQYLISLSAVAAVSAVCYILSPWLGYRVVALLLLLTVSIIAVLYDILPVLLAATLSAFTWDFFFIPPHFTIHVNSTEDAILLTMYFVIAMVNAVLTYKIRQLEKVARQRREKARAVQLYNAFFNSLSHELKTPIATIIAATDNLQDEATLLPESQRKELAGVIGKAAQRLQSQVDNMLHLSRLEAGFLQPKADWCDVEELIYRTIAQLKPAAARHPVQVITESPLPLFRLDAGMLEQILVNLLSNAYRYGGPEVQLTVRALTEGDRLVLSVEDNGPGIPPSERERVFEKFFRLPGEHAGGTGLGLSIVKGFASAMGGEAELAETPGGGASFIVRIPAGRLDKKWATHEQA